MLLLCFVLKKELAVLRKSGFSKFTLDYGSRSTDFFFVRVCDKGIYFGAFRVSGLDIKIGSTIQF